MKTNRRKAVRKRNIKPLRTSRERTSHGQAQALWTFLVATAVVIAALLQLNTPSRAFSALSAEDRAPASQGAPSMIIPTNQN